MIYDKFLDSEDTTGSSHELRREALTPKDEKQINAAILDSIEFMAGYGKGREPQLINRKHYL